jgi:tryptophanyl-tRNA synthetase
MSLTDPTQKMSKSDPNPNSRILLNDTREEIQKKVNSALTDSEDGITFDREHRPGWSNLIEIVHHLKQTDDKLSCEELAQHLNTMRKRDAKRWIADVIDLYLSPIRERYDELIHTASRSRILDWAEHGKESASDAARQTMAAVQGAVGIHFRG